MKANLLYDPSGPILDNFVNICPFVDPDNQKENLLVGSVHNLDEHVDNGELDELWTNDVIEYVPIPDVPSTLGNWVSKLRVGGKLYMEFMDARIAAKDFANYREDLREYNRKIHGEQIKPFLLKRSAHTVHDLCDHMTKFHTIIVKRKQIINGNAVLEFERTS